MAELDTSGGGGKKGKKVRSKKQSTRVDLTAMVDLAFLLITFFMLTTSLQKPQAMDAVMPDKDDKQPDANLAVRESRTLTVLLGSDNKVLWYVGTFDKPIEGPKTADFTKDGIRKVIIETNNKVKAQGGAKNNGAFVIIKASDKSNYKNFVDILDEMKITNIQTFGPADITPPEVEGLKKENLYN
ncbi:MAG: biopolymer transporter ExbD [Mucilaginibacter polytrichastri]|nr:biopolymer transporter ExbD [Mucilaginibacter polytrichastri]